MPRALRPPSRSAAPPWLVLPQLLVRTAAEVRWSFAAPRTWLIGVGVNVALALLWLAFEPVNHSPGRDWVVLVGSYFASFVMADVTTTNVLGVDEARVRQGFGAGRTLTQVLVAKNLALMVVIGLPLVVLTGGLTLLLEQPDRLAVTLPNVALPVLAWLGVGNLVSVLLPVRALPLRVRWEQRLRLGRTARWLWHLVLPYLLWFAVDPVDTLPESATGQWLSGLLGPVGRSALCAALGIAIWVVGTRCAVAVVRRRGLRVS